MFPRFFQDKELTAAGGRGELGFTGNFDPVRGGEMCIPVTRTYCGKDLLTSGPFMT